MAQVSTNPVLFTATGLLSAQKGPNAAGFPVNGSNNSPRQRRIQGIKVLKETGASGGAVEIFDSISSQIAPSDSVYRTNVSEAVTNLGINIKSGDIYVVIPTGWKVYLYLDQNN